MKTYYFEIEMTDKSVLHWSGLTERTAEEMYNKMATRQLGSVRSYEWGEEEEDGECNEVIRSVLIEEERYGNHAAEYNRGKEE